MRQADGPDGLPQSADPRFGPLDQRDGVAVHVVLHGQDVGVPEVVKLAQALQALTQATGQSEAEAMAESLKAAGITRYHLDDFDVSFDGTQDPAIKARDGLAEDVYKLLLPYLDRGGVAYVI